MSRHVVFAVVAVVALYAALPVVTAAQTADGSGTDDMVSQPTDFTVLPQVRPGGLLANRSPDAVIDLARSNAATQAGVPLDQVSVVSVQPTEWPDFSLGCRGLLPRFSVAQVTVPGFIVELDVAGTQVTYHTDRGLRAIPCPVSPAPTDTSDQTSG
jgi:hypothetical protein